MRSETATSGTIRYLICSVYIILEKTVVVLDRCAGTPDHHGATTVCGLRWQPCSVEGSRVSRVYLIMLIRKGVKVNDHESEAATRPSCVFETASPHATSFGLLCGSLSAAMPTPYLERPVEPNAQLAYSGTGTALETA